MTTLLIILVAILYAALLLWLSKLFGETINAALEEKHADPEVPITPELLEKIGFVRSEVLVEWKYEREDVYMLWKPFPWIKIQSEDFSLMFTCEYVHHLRQALELAQIDINVNWEEL